MMNLKKRIFTKITISIIKHAGKAFTQFFPNDAIHVRSESSAINDFFFCSISLCRK